MKIFTSSCWHFLFVFAYWTVSDAANQCPFTDPEDSRALSFCTKALSSTKRSSETVLIGTWNSPKESTWNCSCTVSPLNKKDYWTASLTYGGLELSPCPVRLQVGGGDWSSCKDIDQTPVSNSYAKITLTKTVLEHQHLCVTLSAPAGLHVLCLQNSISAVVSTVQTHGTAGTSGTARTSTTNTPETTTNSQESDTETIVVIVVVCFVVVVLIIIASVCIIKFRKQRKPKKVVKDDEGQKDPDYDVTTITENWLYNVDMNDVTSTTPTPITMTSTNR